MPQERPRNLTGFPKTRTGNAARKLLARRTGWVAVLAIVPPAALLVYELLRPTTQFLPFGQFVYWMPIYLSLGYNRLGARRFARRLADQGYRLCCFCDYDLRNLPDFGRCPECGEWYDIKVTCEEWTNPQNYSR
jgi:hypothetical protein